MTADRPGDAIPSSAEAVCQRLNVSRETQERLTTLVDLLGRWQRRINLVGPATLPDVWRRHILDCGQLALRCDALRPPWYDLGSGAGFPGLVLSIMGLGPVHLVESDRRKCAFLREAVRVTGSDAVIVNCRIEDLAAGAAHTITARAVAPVARLVDLATPLVGVDTSIWLWKGQDIEEELTRAAKCWNMRAERWPSMSDPRGTLLHLREVARVHAVRSKPCE